MYEMGVVLNVVRKLDSYAEMNHIGQINTVVMSVGEVSSIEAPYFVSSWEYAAARSKHLVNSGVKIEKVPGIGRCMLCNEQFNLLENDGKCPHCRTSKWQLVSGRDVVIKEILVEEGDK